MAEANPPVFVDGTTSPAAHARRMMQAVMGPGIARAGDLAVTQNGTPNMTVNVASGGAFVAGSSGTYQGTYFVENQGTVNKAIATAHPTNPRRDIVVARVRENAVDGSGVTAWDIHVVTGTAAAVPAVPATPANCLRLAVVSVDAGATSITTAKIAVDGILARPWNSAWGEIGSASRSTTFSWSGTAITDVTGLTLSFDALPGRLYRASIELPSVSVAAASIVAGYITLADNTVLRQCNQSVPAGGYTNCSGSRRFESTGTVTLKARVVATVSGTNIIDFSSENLGTLIVEDIGPA